MNRFMRTFAWFKWFGVLIMPVRMKQGALVEAIQVEWFSDFSVLYRNSARIT